ncbi:MAG TPA: hypothetical protein ENN60_02750 [archaeon]|nr:hypothetical protein [archaeon]
MPEPVTFAGFFTLERILIITGVMALLTLAFLLFGRLGRGVKKGGGDIPPLAPPGPSFKL